MQIALYKIELYKMSQTIDD